MKDGLTPSKIDQFLAKIKPHPVVALVDDDPQSLDSIARALSDEGYEIHQFTSVEDFLKEFSTMHPDAIVMEAILPGMSGVAALDELRPTSPEEIIPVLIISKKDDVRAKLLAFRKGAFDYLTKPFESEEVAARVRSLVRSKIIQDMLQASSILDPLTTLYNRRFLLVWVEREMERIKRYGLELSCLAVDLDRFQKINEENGADFGDYVLQGFARFITQNLRKSDIVGRVQNDEFLILLPGTSTEEAMIVARRLRRLAQARSFEQGSKKAKPNFCIGITSCHSREVPEASVFLEKAEEALLKAKAVGVGETAVFTGSE